jgi:hypothetical protein
MQWEYPNENQAANQLYVPDYNMQGPRNGRASNEYFSNRNMKH